MSRVTMDIEGSSTRCEIFKSGLRSWIEFYFDDGTQLSIGTQEGCDFPDEVFLKTGNEIKLNHRRGKWFKSWCPEFVDKVEKWRRR